MDAQMKRGLTEACVLALLERGDSYGYLLAQQAGLVMPMSESTLYPVLRRLQDSGAVESYAQEHGGRLRRYFRITGTGRARLTDFVREWEELGKIYELILETRRPQDGREAGEGA
ncbi:MAG TPA: PadR family transcriptional regulator [Candidatus Limnocylindria bacterium]|nr:PadR family transcriptional regulator [Candidatus Limnocylindria bacterium]